MKQNIQATWQRSMSRNEQLQQQFLQKRKAENVARLAKGLEPLPDTHKELEIENPQLFKKYPEPWKASLESLLVSHRVSTHCQQITQFAGQTLTKQFIAQSLDSVNKDERVNS